jgi:ATP-dependent Lon protease
VGISQLILPEENREEFEALDDFIKGGITVHFVSHYDQIFPIIFPSFKPKTGIDKCDENKNVN